jgi:hypothetical protein
VFQNDGQSVVRTVEKMTMWLSMTRREGKFW